MWRSTRRCLSNRWSPQCSSFNSPTSKSCSLSRSLIYHSKPNSPISKVQLTLLCICFRTLTFSSNNRCTYLNL